MTTHPTPAPPPGDSLPAVAAGSTSLRHREHLRTPPVVHAEVEPHAEDDELDLLAYWRVLVKHRWLVSGTLIAVLLATLVWTILTPSIYRATATLQIDPYSMQIMYVQGITPAQGRYDPDFAQTQYELLKSRSLAERVAEDLQLAGSNIFERLRPPGWLTRVRSLLGPAAEEEPQAVPPRADTDAAAADGGQPRSFADELARATGLVQGGLVVTPVRNSHLVKVNFDSTLPEFSARVANAIADGFIAASLDRQFGESSYAEQFLEDQLALLRSRLEDSERRLVAYAEVENIVTTSDGSSLVGQNLIDLNRSLAAAQDARISAQARWEQAKSASGAALPGDMLGDSILFALQQQRARLQAEYQDKLRTFKPDYPAMLALKGQLDELEKQLGDELDNIRASVQAEFLAAQAREDMLKTQLQALRNESLDVESRSIQYNILKRDVDTNRELYEGLLQRYKELNVAGGARTSNISIVDRAIVPAGRFSPSLQRNLTLGLLLGLMLGVGLALLLEFLDNTLKTPQDVEAQLNLGVLGIVPKLNQETPEEALLDPRSAFSESYRSARTALQFSTDRGVPHTLLVTSAEPGEGKTTTALTLARNFAQLGKRVLLLEADMRDPDVGRLLAVAAGPGLSSLLSGAASLSQVVCSTSEKGLDLLQCGPLPPSPTELLSSTRFVSLMRVCADKYDQVIIDGPPVLNIADAPILANIATGTLLVVRSGSTRIHAAQTAVKRLHMARARVIGALLTSYDAKKSGAQYSYGGAYYGGYGLDRLGSW